MFSIFHMDCYILEYQGGDIHVVIGCTRNENISPSVSIVRAKKKTNMISQ